MESRKIIEENDGIPNDLNKIYKIRDKLIIFQQKFCLKTSSAKLNALEIENKREICLVILFTLNDCFNLSEFDIRRKVF